MNGNGYEYYSYGKDPSLKKAFKQNYNQNRRASSGYKHYGDIPSNVMHSQKKVDGFTISENWNYRRGEQSMIMPMQPSAGTMHSCARADPNSGATHFQLQQVGIPIVPQQLQNYSDMPPSDSFSGLVDSEGPNVQNEDNNVPLDFGYQPSESFYGLLFSRDDNRGESPVPEYIDLDSSSGDDPSCANRQLHEESFEARAPSEGYEREGLASLIRKFTVMHRGGNEPRNGGGPIGRRRGSLTFNGAL
ncbi:hypothetical protein MOQ_009550 [Trypanosoma cruzi marinkellei]|uniref:Uncharacterized protein n=1 Tax=Trypanosoma cruzi marinkellei TaxID=85056 RepID=K2MI05_TRYCR|nr:hypothetical protein MOQ_009550 [Trypanosoma cruzi marinkellei]